MGGIAIVYMISGGNIFREVKRMTTVEQIDYMIQSLKLAKDEIEYAEEYMKTKEKEGEDFYKWGHMGDSNRVPNGTIIRESLKMVGRMANIAANNVCLSPYNNCIFKE